MAVRNWNTHRTTKGAVRNSIIKARTIKANPAIKLHDQVIYSRKGTNSVNPVWMTAVVRAVYGDGTYSIATRHILDSSGKPAGPEIRINSRVAVDELELMEAT